jgi:anti-sigma factor RsiW
MSGEQMHPLDALHAAVDGLATQAERAALDQHLAECAQCRREFDALSALTRQLPGALRDGDGPADLEARLRGVLDDEDRRAADADGRQPPGLPPARPVRAWRWAGLAASLAAMLVLTIVWSERTSDASAPQEVARDFRRFASGELSLATRTTDPASLERELRETSLGFAPRVFDFGMMAFQLEGGGVHRVGGQPSALFAYRGPDALRLLCQMYEGQVAALPAPDERRTNDSIEFLVYRQDDVTVVFWQEGDVVCALAANGGTEAAVQLAFAKAVRT